MDTSKKFQLMLDKAIKLYPTDFINFDRTKNIQDQLQEMTDDTIGKYPNLAVIDRLVLFKEMIFRENIFYSSWEQFWLGFIMQQKYSKTWNKEDWVK